MSALLGFAPTHCPSSFPKLPRQAQTVSQSLREETTEASRFRPTGGGRAVAERTGPYRGSGRARMNRFRRQAPFRAVGRIGRRGWQREWRRDARRKEQQNTRWNRPATPRLPRTRRGQGVRPSIPLLISEAVPGDEFA